VRCWASQAQHQLTAQLTALKGTINSIIDASGREQVRFYQVNLTLISLADNEIAWNGEKKIKKFVTKPIFRF